MISDSRAAFGRQEKIANLAFGLSFVSWALLGLMLPEDRGSAVRWSIAALHLTAGILILLRVPTVFSSKPMDVMLCVPAIISAGIVFNLAAPTDTWDPGANAIFLMCTLWTIGSLVVLGKSFAVFPSVRNIVVTGPFSFVRHPAYLGELGMVVACVWASDWSTSGGYVVSAFAFVLVTIAIRILIEEKLLSRTESYREYCGRVRWRLLPLIW